MGALRAGGFGWYIDPEAVLEFLEFGFVTEERSIYRGIRKLPPATILEWRGGHLTTRCYWTLPEIDLSSTIGFEDAVERTEELIVDAVRLRVQADVPVGALLSGGVDSALVCWALKKINANITAFTVTTPGDPADEDEDARLTADVLGIPQRSVALHGGGTVPVEELVNAYSEPFACQSAAGMLRVSEAVKPFATVLLTGDGGDEVFCGYPFMYNAWRAERIAQRLPRAATPAWHVLRNAIPPVGLIRRGRNFFDYVVGGLGSYNRVRQGLPYFEERNLLGERLAFSRLSQRQFPASADSARRLFSDVLAYQKKTHFQSEFLPKVDASTMYYAIEARSPFLDQVIWEFASQLPAQIRFHGGKLKAILRAIVARRVDPRVAVRQKRGFTVPVEAWLRQSPRILDALRHGSLIERAGWIEAGRLGPAIDAALRSKVVPTQLWYLVVLESWMRRERSAGCEPIRSERLRVAI